MSLGRKENDKMLRLQVLAFAILVFFTPASAAALKILAAENFYGDIASQIGGADVEVTSVLNNPAQDPHLFEVSPSLARDVAAADFVILNGVDYDPWMENLLSASPNTARHVISAGALAGRKAGDNPHLWYDLEVSRLVGKAIADSLAEAAPVKAEKFKANDAAFNQSLDQLAAQVDKIAKAHAAVRVAATEPVFGYMLEAMGLAVQEKEFQWAVMNDTEPAFSDVARFEDDLKQKAVKLLIYNKQATDPVADKFLALAQAQDIPVVAVTETMPEKVTYQQWLGDEITALAKALGGGT
jgi:zinc/manganese transport system substrate-binding protein